MLIFDGEKGKSLFNKPFSSIEFGIKNNTETVPLFQKIDKTQDDRARTILQALVIESLTDEILQKFLPGYKKLSENKDFSFSMKQSLLLSTELIPEHIIKCGSIVRAIRNEFAHNLNLEELDKVDQKFIYKMRSMLSNLKYPGLDVFNTDPKKLFHHIGFIAISGLSSYLPNMDILNKTIRSEQFLNDLKNKSDDQDNKLLEELLPYSKETQLEGGGKINSIGEETLKEYKKNQKK